MLKIWLKNNDSINRRFVKSSNRQQPIFNLSIWPSFGTRTIRCTINNWQGQCPLYYHEKPSRWNQARKRHFKIELVPEHDPHQETFKPHRTTIQTLRHYTILPRIDRKKIRRCLSNHNVKTVLKPCNTIGKKLANHKDSVDPNMRQGTVYQIPCIDCDFSYIGETKRSFSIRKKEHLADIRHLWFDKSALTKRDFDNEHSMGWTNAKILDFELDFTKRRFVGSYFINEIPNTMND